MKEFILTIYGIILEIVNTILVLVFECLKEIRIKLRRLIYIPNRKH